MASSRSSAERDILPFPFVFFFLRGFGAKREEGRRRMGCGRRREEKVYRGGGSEIRYHVTDSFFEGLSWMN